MHNPLMSRLSFTVSTSAPATRVAESDGVFRLVKFGIGCMFYINSPFFLFSESDPLLHILLRMMNEDKAAHRRPEEETGSTELVPGLIILYIM